MWRSSLRKACTNVSGKNGMIGWWIYSGAHWNRQEWTKPEWFLGFVLSNSHWLRTVLASLSRPTSFSFFLFFSFTGQMFEVIGSSIVLSRWLLSTLTSSFVDGWYFANNNQVIIIWLRSFLLREISNKFLVVVMVI